MNITLTISSLGAGGAEKVLSALANYLTKKHQVTIVTLAANTSKPFYFTAFKTIYFEFFNFILHQLITNRSSVCQDEQSQYHFRHF